MAERKRVLPLMVASTIKALADAAKPALVEIKTQEERVAAEQKKLDNMKNDVAEIDRQIRNKLKDYGDYGLDDIFMLETKEVVGSNGKTSKQNKMVWRYKLTQLPPKTEETNEQTEETETTTEAVED